MVAPHNFTNELTRSTIHKTLDFLGIDDTSVGADGESKRINPVELVAGAGGILNDGTVPMAADLTMGGWEIRETNGVYFREVTDPTAVSNEVIVYAKDNGGTSHLYARTDDGTVHDLLGGGIADWQEAYEADSSLDVTAAEGSPTIANSTDATDLLTLTRTFAGAGRALNVTMGASTTGDAVYITAASGATGYALVIQDAAAVAARISRSGTFFVANGSITAPSVAALNDPDSGVFFTGSDSTRVVAGGSGSYGMVLINSNQIQLITSASARIDVSSTGVIFSVQARLPGGATATPGLAFSAETNLGLYRSAAQTMRFAAGNADRILFASSAWGPIGDVPYSQFTANTPTRFVAVGGTTSTRDFGFEGGTLSASTAIRQDIFRITGTINQSGSAVGYTGILLNATETATVGADNRLLDLQVGGASKFRWLSGSGGDVVHTTGEVTSSAGTVVIATVALDDESVYNFVLEGVARDQSGTSVERCGVIVHGMAYREGGGGATLSVATVNSHASPHCAISLQANGNSIEAFGANSSGLSIKYRVLLRWQKVS